MKSDRARWWKLIFTTVVLAGVAALPAGISTKDFPRPADNRILTAYAELPLHFEANQGQTHPSVKFLSRGAGYRLFLTSTEVVLVLSKSEQSQATVKNGDSAVVRMQLSGANPLPEVTGVEELAGKTHYFGGNDPANWRTNVPNYAKVRYRGVYPGIDSIYYGNGRQLEYDFVVAPGADPDAVRLVFDGSEGVTIDGQGDLVLQAGDGQIRLLKPVAYQQVSGNRLEIPVEYVLMDGQKVAFNVGRYDEQEPLVIDPVISYATYFGGSLSDVADGIAVDSSGNAYITGGTASTNFPTAAPLQSFNEGGQDVFVSKLNPAGSALIYSTYLGGDNDDYGEGIAIDSSGNAYIAGHTSSSNFPTANAVQSNLSGPQDAFLTKLNTDGSALIYSTYLGGTLNEVANSIAVDGSGNAYVAGFTTSINFPTVNEHQMASGGGTQDAFVAKLNAAGDAYVYASYLGGNGPGTAEQAWTVAVDGSQNAYVVGTTDSSNFPTVNPRQQFYGGGPTDAFVTKWSSAGVLEYSTYHGGNGDDTGLGIAVDGSGNIYVTGSTGSGDFPTSNAYQPTLMTVGLNPRDAYVSKFNSAGSAFVYSTYLGGGAFESALAVTADDSGNAYVVGATNSTDFPTANPTQPFYGGGELECEVSGFMVNCTDAFVSKFNSSGSTLLFSTYFGGNRNDFSRDIAVVSGNIYIAGLAISQNLPTTNPLQPNYGGGDSDGFILKIMDTVSKKVRGQITSQ